MDRILHFKTTSNRFLYKSKNWQILFDACRCRCLGFSVWWPREASLSNKLIWPDLWTGGSRLSSSASNHQCEPSSYQTGGPSFEAFPTLLWPDKGDISPATPFQKSIIPRLGSKWWQKTKYTFPQCASLSALAGCPTPQADFLELKLCGKCTTIKKSKSVLKKEKVKASKSGVRGTVPFELGKSLGRVTSAYPSARTKGTIAI